MSDLNALFLTVGSCCRREVITCAPSDRLTDAAAAMQSSTVSSLVVCESGNPVGILTDRDIVVRVDAQMLDVEKVLAREVMSSPLVTVPKQEDARVAVALMCRCGIRRLPIVDEQGRLFSIITLDDVLLLHLAGQDDLTGIIRRQLHPDLKAENPAGPAKGRFADLAPPAPAEQIPHPMPVAGRVHHAAGRGQAASRRVHCEGREH